MDEDISSKKMEESVKTDNSSSQNIKEIDKNDQISPKIIEETVKINVCSSEEIEEQNVKLTVPTSASELKLEENDAVAIVSNNPAEASKTDTIKNYNKEEKDCGNEMGTSDPEPYADTEKKSSEVKNNLAQVDDDFKIGTEDDAELDEGDESDKADKVEETGGGLPDQEKFDEEDKGEENKDTLEKNVEKIMPGKEDDKVEDEKVEDEKAEDEKVEDEKVEDEKVEEEKKEETITVPTEVTESPTDDATATTSTKVSKKEHITYKPDGSAIYTDPKTKLEYKWCTKENYWLPLYNGVVPENPFENDYYRWCKKTRQWLLKQERIETEYYKWDLEKKVWVLKPQFAARTNGANRTAAATATAATAATTAGATATTVGALATTATTAEATATTATTAEATATTATTAEATATTATTAESTTTAAVSKADVTYGIDEDGQRIYTDKDGSVFFWNTEKKAWFPKIDDDFMAHYQMNYGFIDNTSASEKEKKEKAEAEAQRKEEELKHMAEEAKRATDDAAAVLAAGGTAAGIKRKGTQEPPKWFNMNPEHNTKVYVSNLPLDITMDEFIELMGKCGMIMRDQQTQKYKIKLYTEPDGQIKGDGLCDYIKVESVDLALNILDEYNLRGNKIRVQRAKFEMRGEYNPALKPKRKKKDKEKLQKMKEKLFDWRPERMRGERTKNERVVIIKNLFEPEMFEKDVQQILNLQNKLREECCKYGVVRKAIVYDRHPEGVAQVNMASPEEADIVIASMNGRLFGKRRLTAESWDGKTKYKIQESETEAQSRLSNWDQFLEDEKEDEKTTEKTAGAAAVP